MANINDKLGRPSDVNSYALPTIVKSNRLPGESVLEAYDLSRFDDTLPVYFLTYKKVTDPTTGKVSAAQQTSWKALVNKDNNTLTNLQVAPGYTDLGNDQGDYIELMPTSFWGNELVGGLLVSHNPDGTLKDGSAIPGVIGVDALPAGFDMTNLDSLKTLGNGIYQNTNVAVNAPAPYGFLRVAKHTDGESFTFEYSIIGDKAAGLWQLAINENTVAPVTWTMIAGGSSTYFEVPPAITTHGGTNWGESSSLGFLKVVDGFVVGARYSVSFAINFVRDDNASGHGFVLRKANEDGSGAIELSRTEQYGRNGSSWVGHTCQGSFVATGTKQRIYANIRIANGTTAFLVSGTSKATFIINRVDF